MVNIISRSAWGARPPKRPREIVTVPWSRRIGVAWHYSDGSKFSTPADLQAYAQDSLNYNDTHYNLFVDYKGNAYEGRGWLVVAAHALNQNTPWVGICFIGREGDVTPEALRTMRDLYDEANRLSGRTLQYSGHGQLPGQSTNCPGNTIKTWISQGMPRPGGTSEGDNMWCAREQTGDNVLELQIRLVDAGVHVGPEGETAPADDPYRWCDSEYGGWTTRALASVTGDAGDRFGPWQNRMLKAREKAVGGSGPLPGQVKLHLPPQTVVLPAVQITAEVLAS